MNEQDPETHVTVHITTEAAKGKKYVTLAVLLFIGKTVALNIPLSDSLHSVIDVFPTLIGAISALLGLEKLGFINADAFRKRQ